MSEKEINKYIKDLSANDKKRRQKACESLEVRGLVLSNKDIDLLKKAVSSLEKTKESDKDRGVKKKATSAYNTLSNHLQKIEKPQTTGWGSTTTEEKSSTSSKAYDTKEGEPEPALEYVIEETLNGTLTISGELDSESIETSGVLKVKNLSSSERIFDVNFSLDDKGLSSLEEDKFHFNEIQSEEERVIEYGINIEKVDDVAIEFKEVIDTSPDTEEDSNVLVFGQEMSTKIKYNFTAKKSMKSFKLTKELPSGFENVVVDNCSLGTANIDGGNVVWSLEDVEDGASGNLDISGLFKVKDLEDISTGKATVEFNSLTDTHSGLKLSEEKEGRVQSRQLVESNEISEEPDNWMNKFVFENPSGIDILLKYVKMTDPNGEDPSTPVVSLTDPILVKAGGEWVSEEFKTYSESIPTFNKDLDLSVGSVISIDARSKFIVEPGALRVANISATKVFEINQVPSYRETPLPTEIVIENIGAITYSNLLITDRIPEQFLPPINDDMTLTLVTEEDEETLNPDSDYEFSVEGDEENSEAVKMVNITCNRDIEPGAKLRWNYAPRAYKPLPDHTYNFHTDIEAKLSEKAPPLTFELPEDLAIQVIHQRRNVTIGKTILPGSKKDEYEIELFYKNRGTAVLSNLIIKDFIPDQFSVGSENVDFKTTDEDGNEIKVESESSEEETPDDMEFDGKLKVWKFESVKPDNKIFIKYSISGSGEYSMRQAQMTFT